ncbi:serine hydrolase domain-containing protein [Caulobacter segnis]|uniref:serine hydrolase domain-containing protein n=1 Tax=Caulobacter segnis TaxID=88688 RepID=UPI0028577B41|nr:serine hydrolase domain-containing protein [Caulobacter segnis]MDR6627861.1 CubicO group peptidase (beta-lactamase class C family) [Caulobacter segnis]
MRVHSAFAALGWAALLASVSLAPAFAASDDRKLDAEIDRLRDAGKIPGVAMALVENGKLVYVTARGVRNAKGDPLTPDTVMYAASVTKATFAYYVMMLVDEGKLDLDKPIATYLPKPLPDYKAYADLANDPRWREITPRMLMTHSAGFPNFRWLNPDEKLDIKFQPGSRYAYAGEGINLMQFVIEQGLGLNVGEEMNRRLFQPLGMTRSSMIWRDDFAGNLADGQDENGKWEPHDDRSSVKAAGSLDTTIGDMGKLAAAMASGWGLSAKARAEFAKPSLPIKSAHEFPTLTTEENPDNAKIGLAAGIGVVVFDGPQGPSFLKGGHNEITDNMLVCVGKGRRCVVILTNSGVGQRVIPALVKAALGETGAPWSWEYSRLPALTP